MTLVTGERAKGFFPGAKIEKVNASGVEIVPTGVFRLPAGATAFLRGNERGFLIGGKFVEQRAAKERVEPDAEGFYNLQPGTYEIGIPKLRIPLDVTGFAYPRSSFSRLGILKTESAVWDSGYEGEGMQVFHFPLAAQIHKDEPWVQFVFLRNSEDAKRGYSGYYQSEKR